MKLIIISQVIAFMSLGHFLLTPLDTGLSSNGDRLLCHRYKISTDAVCYWEQTGASVVMGDAY